RRGIEIVEAPDLSAAATVDQIGGEHLQAHDLHLADHGTVPGRRFPYRSERGEVVAVSVEEGPRRVWRRRIEIILLPLKCIDLDDVAFQITDGDGFGFLAGRPEQAA